MIFALGNTGGGHWTVESAVIAAVLVLLLLALKQWIKNLLD